MLMLMVSSRRIADDRHLPRRRANHGGEKIVTVDQPGS